MNCLTCYKATDDNSVKCSTCKVGFYLGLGGCYEACGVVLMVPDVSGFVCVGCAVKCLTCRDNKDYCLRCSTSSAYKYFHNNDCLTNCPDGYYNDQSSSTFYCQTCTPPC